MNKIEHISHKNHHYEMIAYFQNDVLTISLKELSSKDPNTFFQTLKDSTLPDDLKNHLESTQFIFQCLKEKPTHEIDPKNGFINLKTFFNFSSKIMEKKSKIKLIKAQGNLQSFSHEIFFLKKEIQLIKERPLEIGEEKMNTELIQELQKLNIQNQKSIKELKQQNKEKEEQVYVMTQYIQKLKERLDKLQTKGESTQGNTLKDAQVVQIKEEKKIIQSKIEKKELVQNTIFLKRFNIEQSKITYKGEDKRRTQVLFARPINKEEKPIYFSWKILKTLDSSIIFGIVDKETRKNMRTSCDSGAAISYNGINGKIWLDKKECKNEGKGFKEGQIVMMQIDVESGKINWTVNSELRGTIVSKMLKDGEKTFVPYMELYDKQDAVQCLF